MADCGLLVGVELVFVACLIVVFRLWRVCCCAIEFGVFVFAVGGACLFVL